MWIHTEQPAPIYSTTHTHTLARKKCCPFVKSTRSTTSTPQDRVVIQSSQLVCICVLCACEQQVMWFCHVGITVYLLYVMLRIAVCVYMCIYTVLCAFVKGHGKKRQTFTDLMERFSNHTIPLYNPCIVNVFTANNSNLTISPIFLRLFKLQLDNSSSLVLKTVFKDLNMDHFIISCSFCQPFASYLYFLL